MRPGENVSIFFEREQARPSAGRPPAAPVSLDDGSQKEGGDDREVKSGGEGEPGSALAETPARKVLNKPPARARLRCCEVAGVPRQMATRSLGGLASPAPAGPDRPSLTRGAR
jgi:hypothetical protein